MFAGAPLSPVSYMAAERRVAGHGVPVEAIPQDGLNQDILVVEEKHVGGWAPKSLLWTGGELRVQRRCGGRRCCDVARWVSLYLDRYLPSASPKVSAKKLPRLQHHIYQVAHSRKQ
jgi:hypothetical protein